MKWLKPKWFRRTPFQHQKEALSRTYRKEFFALLMEQGTGKSFVIVNDAANLWREHLIDTLVILAPKGIAPEWVRVQIPDHMPEDMRYVAALWKAPSRMTRAAEKQVAATLADDTGALKILVMNLEAFGSTTEALDFVIGVLDNAQSAMVVVDESHRIKNPQAHTTKRIINLRIRSAYRRILTGTVADTPFDVYSQFEFLSPKILDCPSFVAFKREYAELEPDTSGIMRHIAQRVPKVFKGRYAVTYWNGRYVMDNGRQTEDPRDADGVPLRKKIVSVPHDEIPEEVMALLRENSGAIVSTKEKLMEPKYLPQIVAKNDDGSPKYRNLDKLHALIAPHSFRVRKVDCLDLPPKYYSRYHTDLSDRQWTLYNQLKEEFRIDWEDGRVTTYNRLSQLVRLQQIVCGYLPREGEMIELFPSWRENPRIVSTLEMIEDRPDGEHIIIWCRFVEDIRRLREALVESYGADQVVEFHGSVKDKAREEAVARFEGERRFMKDGKIIRTEEVPTRERARFMLAQARAGGIGQTWISSTLSCIYSNLFSLIDRLQLEDRPHRIGQTMPVDYKDIEADGTIDGKIISTLVAKKNVADVIQGDEASEWLQ